MYVLLGLWARSPERHLRVQGIYDNDRVLMYVRYKCILSILI